MVSTSFLIGVLLFELQAVSFVGLAVLLFELLVWPGPKDCNPPGVFHAIIQVSSLWELCASVFHLGYCNGCGRCVSYAGGKDLLL